MDYWVKGNTYTVKDELKEWGCLWDDKRRMWKLTGIESKNDPAYKEIAMLGCQLIAVHLSSQAKTIQDILNKKRGAL